MQRLGVPSSSSLLRLLTSASAAAAAASTTSRPLHCLHGIATSWLRRSSLFSSLAGDMDEPSLLRGVHAFVCPDQVGITAKITECIASRGASIQDFDVHVNFDVVKEPIFFSRTEFVFDPSQWPRDIMDEDFIKLRRTFNAMSSTVRVFNKDPPLKIAVLVSRKDHCLVDLLHLWQEGKIPVQLKCVVSNHERLENTHVMRFLARHNIPYFHVPASKEDKCEKEVLRLVNDTDFLVLARYMQILSPDFLNSYKKNIINIHHGLLPSFKGANPYKQAYEAGVKIIGATSHFVTEELDGGPIIEQMVERVSHRDSLNSFAMKSVYLEKACLAKAIKYYCELRIFRYSKNRTIVFD